MQEYKFAGDKYMTRGIKEEMPAVLVGYIWGLIEERKRNKRIPMDYLQVFKLKPMIKNDEEILMITHSQEEPSYKEVHQLNHFTKIAESIFVIDDKKHVTMMLAEEY